MKILSLPPLLIALAVTSPLAAHEFWLEAAPPHVATGSAVTLAIRRGEDFNGEVRPINTERVTAWRHYAAGGVTDATAKIPAVPGVESLAFPLSAAGTHLFAVDSTPSQITLSADKFTSYLREDGLEFVETARKAAGQENAPGRERYLRCVKTLVQAGGKSDATFATRTGQRLEIVPQTDPFATRAGGRIAFTVWFDRQPLAGALVRAWHHADATLVTIKGRTDAQGMITFDFPFAGPWMISLVHMIPLTDMPDYDWQSYWGNLTFAIPSP